MKTAMIYAIKADFENHADATGVVIDRYNERIDSYVKGERKNEGTVFQMTDAHTGRPKVFTDANHVYVSREKILEAKQDEHTYEIHAKVQNRFGDKSVEVIHHNVTLAETYDELYDYLRSVDLELIEVTDLLVVSI